MQRTPAAATRAPTLQWTQPMPPRSDPISPSWPCLSSPTVGGPLCLMRMSPSAMRRPTALKISSCVSRAFGPMRVVARLMSRSCTVQVGKWFAVVHRANCVCVHVHVNAREPRVNPKRLSYAFRAPEVTCRGSTGLQFSFGLRHRLRFRFALNASSPLLACRYACAHVHVLVCVGVVWQAQNARMRMPRIARSPLAPGMSAAVHRIGVGGGAPSVGRCRAVDCDPHRRHTSADGGRHGGGGGSGALRRRAATARAPRRSRPGPSRSAPATPRLRSRDIAGPRRRGLSL